MEKVLNRLLTKTQSLGLINEIVMADGMTPMSHLQYTDDTVLFLKNVEKSLRNVKKILLLFQVFSGLKVNFQKSQIFQACNDKTKIIH